ncbi:MAG: hypothetical protein QXU18_00435 [Thermoplasmatales archaeon]
MVFTSKMDSDQLRMTLRHVRRVIRAGKEPNAANVIRYARVMFGIAIGDDTARKYIRNAQSPDPAVNLKPKKWIDGADKDEEKIDLDEERDKFKWDSLPHDALDAYISRMQEFEKIEKETGKTHPDLARARGGH